MKVAALLLAVALVGVPSAAMAQRGGGGPRGMFGGGHHGGHPINAWMGSHRPKLR